ncbi:MAG: outer membrane protein assembly factor BamE [Rhodobacter sp.]|uniref:outer membrane protein assembly factor BamE n=1 Tax=Pararhodobacter sp. TaxID=2127056 RepID=UPI001DA9F629|nr:outer membrane protein assembly factor BamE [Pararhodobacter sp.]MCB1344815.1 outer membrane protein assembly factor BamE [Paracoccaceae bacterium]MCC0074054.1 outer membrane protein assembly factor BamE [Rhodobacter sp.]HPD91844.1 outer membrane protein assembly factor BamE [Pararhodobacter sp.]
MTMPATTATRKTRRRGGLRAWALGLGLLAAACSPVMRYHGYAPTDADLSQIQVGRDTRETVAQKIGQPGIGGVMEGSGWYYVQSDWRQQSWHAAEEVDRQVVAISFDSRDRVQNIERFGLADGEVVPLSRRVTSSGPRPSVLSQVFAVLGQFSAATAR